MNWADFLQAHKYSRKRKVTFASYWVRICELVILTQIQGSFNNFSVVMDKDDNGLLGPGPF